jgi:hypothetical protein
MAGRVALVADSDHGHAPCLVVGRDDDQRVVRGIVVAVGHGREVDGDLDRAVELDHVPDRPLRVYIVRALVDRGALDHQVEAVRGVRVERGEREAGQLVEHGLVAHRALASRASSSL